MTVIMTISIPWIDRATKVPVGEDQAPHLELAQDLAESFNHHYGPTFPIPQPLMGTSC